MDSRHVADVAQWRRFPHPRPNHPRNRKRPPRANVGQKKREAPADLPNFFPANSSSQSLMGPDFLNTQNFCISKLKWMA